MKHIFTHFITALALAIQVCQVQAQCPFLEKTRLKKEDIIDFDIQAQDEDVNKLKYDPPGLRGHPDRDQIMKNYNEWYSCKFSDRPESECDALYEVLVLKGTRTIENIHKYKELNETLQNIHSDCLNSGRLEGACKVEKAIMEKYLNELKDVLYPWLDTFEICEAAQSQGFCERYIKFFHLPDYLHLTPEGLIATMKRIICVSSGKSIEECVPEGPFADGMAFIDPRQYPTEHLVQLDLRDKEEEEEDTHDRTRLAADEL